MVVVDHQIGRLVARPLQEQALGVGGKQRWHRNHPLAAHHQRFAARRQHHHVGACGDDPLHGPGINSSCAARAFAIARVSRCHRSVEPSMSVKRNVTVPVGPFEPMWPPRS
jgi:hypothetical protein